MSYRSVLFLLLFLLLAIVSLNAVESGPQTVTYTADTSTDIPNPERGWHKNVNLIGGDNYAAVRTSSGMTLARTYVRLDDYRNAALPQSFLDEHTLRFSQVRAAGIKLVLRYSYNFSMGADAPLENVLQHIEQLRPYWQANADVISVVQAGFIGAWGEWHSSTNGLDSEANKLRITNALLAAVPASRMIQIRYPLSIRALYPVPVSATEAFSGSNIARVGFMNDSFLRNTTDAGTYDGPPTWQFMPALWNYVVAMSPSVVTGGETVDNVPVTVGNRQAGPAAMAEMATLHWDYLNRDYATSVIDPWLADGTYAQISRNLGYRLRLTSATMPRTATSGGVLGSIQLDMVNDGWGKVYNPRRLDLILRHSQTGTVSRVQLAADARRLLPLGGKSASIQVQGQLPTLAAGSYAVLLHLADPETAILARPEYSIHLANQGLWETSTGFHSLGMTLEIQGSTVTNLAPHVNAGADSTITLPNGATLSGTASDDGLPAGSTLRASWTKFSGPGTVTFAQATAAATTATFSQAGTYVLQLSASDGTLTSLDTVTVVASGASTAPAADIKMTCDNTYELYVNGSLVGSGTSWTSAQSYTATLKSGANVIAIKGVDSGGPAGLLTEIKVGATRIGSSSTGWKVSSSGPANWNQASYDATTWIAASDFGAYGSGPWGSNVVGMPTDTPAHWIWSKNNETDNEVYVRYAFVVNSDGTITPGTGINTDTANKADITVTCDNSYELFVNGSLVGSGSNWMAAQSYQVAVQSGANVIAIKGVDAGGVAGLLAEVTVGGTRIGSGTTGWKVSQSRPTNWNQATYDASAWAAASDFGAYGTGPWNRAVVGMPTDTPAHWIWSSNNDTHNEVYLRYAFVVDGGATTGLGTITREWWTGIAGNALNTVNWNSAPTGSESITSLEGPTNWADNYGSRIRGYLIAPTTGSYTFWVATDDDGELWLSTNELPVNKEKIASVAGWTNSREWGRHATQKSVAITLTAGQQYYIEVLQKEGNGGDNVAVGWAKPGEATTAPSQVIPGTQLAPWISGIASFESIPSDWLVSRR